MESYINYSNVGERLVESVPEFKERFEKYRANQGGENLPHVLFADFTRFVIDHFNKMDTSVESKSIFLTSIRFIEIVLNANDEQLLNLVSASFLENLLVQPTDYRTKMKHYFGRKTLALLTDNHQKFSAGSL
jgi:hypothetical protein